MTGRNRGETVYEGLTRAKVLPPEERSRRTARRRQLLWTLVFLLVLVAAIVGGHAFWEAYSSTPDPVPGLQPGG